MCTVTLHTDDAGLLVTMNRDEARGRAPELPPRLGRTPSGTAWLGPRDGARGGTWIGVNGDGLVACLLNRYAAGEVPDPDAPSRGELVPEAMAHPTLAEARDWAMTVLDPAPYPPFTLLLAGQSEGCAIAWDGHARSLEALPTPWAMVTSSWFDPDAVAAWRARAFDVWREAGCPLAGALPAFHVLQPPGEAFFAPLMDRGVSCTRSITQVEVRAPGRPATMRYAAAEGRAPDDLAEYVFFGVGEAKP